MKSLKFTNILLSIFLASCLFFVTRPTIVSALIQGQTGSPTLIYETEIKVNQEGFSQVIIKDQNGKVTFLTDENVTHANPVISGDRVAWTAQLESGWQIFIHQISTGKTTQLTKTGNNVNPQISENYLAWEGYKQGTWQIFIFDGIKITQLTKDDSPKQDLQLNNTQVVFSKKEDAKWRIFSYDLNSKELTKISLDQNTNNRNPHLKNNMITWDSFEKDQAIKLEYDPSDKSVKKLSQEVNQEMNTPSSNNSQIETSQTQDTISVSKVDENDIKEELGLVEKINSLKEIKESTTSTPVNLKDTQESTTSEN